jgi:hypothetical protein
LSWDSSWDLIRRFEAACALPRKIHGSNSARSIRVQTLAKRGFRLGHLRAVRVKSRIELRIMEVTAEGKQASKSG